MMKKLNILLLLGGLMLVNGISADVNGEDMLKETKQETKQRKVRSSRKKYSNGDYKENNEIVRVTEGGSYRTGGRRHYHGHATSCGKSDCGMCTNTCAPEPICERTVAVKEYAPACKHISTVARYTCPPDYEVVEEGAGYCAPKSCGPCRR